MRRDIEIAYLGIEIPDPATLTPFFGEVIGLVPGEAASDGAVTWRNDDRAHRIIVEPGPADDAAYVGFEAVDADAFEEGLEAATSPYSSPLVPGGFLTEGVGFGHVVFATTAFDEANRFLVDGLGIARSDWVEVEIMAGIELEVRFYHCNQRHHSVALAKAPFEVPQTLHHLMVETKDRDDVGTAFDRAWATDLPIPNGLGRHDNDGMFGFYVASPAGFQVEVGHGARLITDDWDDDRRYTRISAWGHQPLRQP